MQTIAEPGFSYEGTSLRPGWPQLPLALRTAIESRLDGTVLDATVVGGGFTPGFAAVLRCADGSAFVKAAPTGGDVGSWYAREAQIVAALPADVPAPRLRWADELAGHVVLCFDAVAGRMPALGWSAPDLEAALAAQAAAARALADPSPALAEVVTTRFGDGSAESYDGWGRIAAGEHALPAYATHLAARLDELAAWEARIAEYSAGATGLLHCDLRMDNVLIDPDGRAWICDWNHACRGPAWIDTMALLLTALAGGHDVDALYHAQACTVGTPDDALDVALAALSGYFVVQAARPEIDTSPYVRRHQRYYLSLALTWLARRHDW